MVSLLKRNPLGRGLDALLGSDVSFDSSKKIDTLALDSIRPNPNQPRKHFDTEKMDELAASIQENGVLQPILVRSLASLPGMDPRFEIIAGERRYHAAKRAGLTVIPAVLYGQPTESHDLLKLALIENLQREDLNPIDEAQTYDALINEYAYTQEQLALMIHKSRSYVANLLRLLHLPDSIKDKIRIGELSYSHARNLLKSSDLEADAQKIIDQNLSVREADDLIKPKRPKGDQEGKTRHVGEAPSKSLGGDLARIKEDLEQLLGIRLEIELSGKKGCIRFPFQTLEEFDRILEILAAKRAIA